MTLTLNISSHWDGEQCRAFDFSVFLSYVLIPPLKWTLTLSFHLHNFWVVLNVSHLSLTSTGRFHYQYSGQQWLLKLPAQAWLEVAVACTVLRCSIFSYFGNTWNRDHLHRGVSDPGKFYLDNKHKEQKITLTFCISTGGFWYGFWIARPSCFGSFGISV